MAVGGAQGAALEGAGDPGGGQVPGGEKGLGGVEVGVVKDLEGEGGDFGPALAQDQRMVAAFLQGAQGDVAGVLMGDLQAERVGIKGAAGGKVGYAQFDMAEADDVEGRIKDRGGDGHGACLRWGAGRAER